MLIQEMLQVEHLFQLEVIAEGKKIQLSLKLATLDLRGGSTSDAAGNICYAHVDHGQPTCV